jgi:hypothetical protein
MSPNTVHLSFSRSKAKAAIVAGIIFFYLPVAQASSYLFLDKPYLDLTQQVIQEANAKAVSLLSTDATLSAKYKQVSQSLQTQLDQVRKARLFKKLKPELVTQARDQQFADTLNSFKDALNFMATKAATSPSKEFPSYDTWQKAEASAVSQGLDQRLSAFEARFGPDSESVNVIEYFAGQVIWPGDEASPSAWEPIARLSPVQATTAGSGVVTTAEAGMNYYFLNGEAPVPFRWIGISNHIGVAATLQYLDHTALFHFEGRPAFGVTLHIDRKELGVSYDPDAKKVRVNLGYAFQVIPFAL